MSKSRNRPSAGRTPGKGVPTPARDAKARKAAARRSLNFRLTLGLIAVAVFAIVAVVVANGGSDDKTVDPAPAAVSENLVRADSHRLSTAADGKVTVVEFLDFECEACAAVFPGVEKLRSEYNNKITYVVRYFPLPGHANGEPAARAVEAAAKQGRFEQMYVKMFESQASWGAKREDMSAVFAGYARDLGLDMTRYATDVAAPETSARIKADQQDGIALGVSGTPTFFINGEKFTSRPTYDELKAAVDAALAG